MLLEAGQPPVQKLSEEEWEALLTALPRKRQTVAPARCQRRRCSRAAP